MSPEKKAKWLEALRSGNYKQARGCLKREDGFCCLGVYADAVEHVIWNNIIEGSGSVLGIWVDYVSQGKLQNMNDKELKTFDEIANWIEENM